MKNVIPFPIKAKRPSSLPRQRVFYIGFRYVGPMFCQDVQQLYLKRKGLVCGEKWWAMITYGKYDESDSRTYSIELEECHENDVPDMLDKFEVGNEVNFVELEEMGWQGKVSYSATVKSIFHSCYDGLQFPSFASPLKRNQFGTKVMAQSRSAEAFLKDKALHAYTCYAGGSDGFVWMNLQSFDGQKIKARPVHLHHDVPQDLIAQLRCERSDQL
jgi:hypothetical protein